MTLHEKKELKRIRNSVNSDSIIFEIDDSGKKIFDEKNIREKLPFFSRSNSFFFSLAVSESMDVDVIGLARGGTRYSSTSSLSSAATASSPQTLQTTSSTSNIHNQVATAAVVCQTQGLNLAQGSRESPPASSSPGAAMPNIPTSIQVPFKNFSPQNVPRTFFFNSKKKIVFHFLFDR